MDDTTLRALEERLQYLRNLEKRREEIKSAIENQGRMAASSEMSSAMMSLAPWRASSAVSTPFSGSTNGALGTPESHRNALEAMKMCQIRADNE